MNVPLSFIWISHPKLQVSAYPMAWGPSTVLGNVFYSVQKIVESPPAGPMAFLHEYPLTYFYFYGKHLVNTCGVGYVSYFLCKMGGVGVFHPLVVRYGAVGYINFG